MLDPLVEGLCVVAQYSATVEVWSLNTKFTATHFLFILASAEKYGQQCCLQQVKNWKPQPLCSDHHLSCSRQVYFFNQNYLYSTFQLQSALHHKYTVHV